MNFPNVPPLALYGIFIWAIFWKGISLWRAAKSDQRNWFVVLLILTFVINTLGLLEIAYLFYFAKKRMTIEELKKILFIWKK